MGGERLHGRVAKHADERDLATEQVGQALIGLHGEQGVCSKVEDIVFQTDMCDA